MKYSLRTLLILITLFAIGLCAHRWWEAEKQRRIIPVRVCGEIADIDNTPPVHVAYTPGRFAIRKLKSTIKAAKPAPTPYRLAIAAKEQGTTIATIIKEPTPFAYYWTRKDLEAALSNGESIEALIERLVPLLDDESIDSKIRFQFARILATVGEKRGFDWGLARMRVSDAWDKPPFHDKVLLLHARQTDWIAKIDLWDLLEPRISLPSHANRIGKDLYPGRMKQWYLQQMRRPDATIDEIQACLFELSYFAPSVETLEACSRLFVKPGPEYKWSHIRRHADELTRIGRGGEIFSYSHAGTHIREWYEQNKPTEEELADIRIKVCEFAGNLAGHDHWISREYEEVICEFGDESWREYFKQRLKEIRTRRSAFIALARLEGDNREQFLHKHAAGFEGQTKHLQALAQEILCTELAGTKDQELTTVLTERFRESKKNTDTLIRFLFLLGSDEVASELLTEFRAIHPQPPGADVSKLLIELQSRGFAKELTADKIDEWIMPEKPYVYLPHRLLIEPEEQVRVALEKAGLKTDVDMIAEVDYQFAILSDMSRGEFDVDLVHADASTNMIFFRLGDRVYRYAVKYPDENQSPLTLAAIANAILERLESPNRFVPYGNFEGMSEVDFLFGPHELAELLATQFGVEFHPGWEEYFQPPTPQSSAPIEKAK